MINRFGVSRTLVMANRKVLRRIFIPARERPTRKDHGIRDITGAPLGCNDFRRSFIFGRRVKSYDPRIARSQHSGQGGKSAPNHAGFLEKRRGERGSCPRRDGSDLAKKQSSRPNGAATIVFENLQPVRWFTAS
jgi:hypothetical protein